MNSDLAHYVLRLAFALLIGGLIGIEREIKGKPAGMRTNMLMCTGSCLLMILSIEVARQSGHQGDPGRIAAQVVTGIGFLGAGTIIRSGVSVTGLTSAATLWFVAALGLVIGTGDFALALAAALVILTILTLLVRIERGLAVRQHFHILKFKLEASTQPVKDVRNLLHRFHLTPEDISLSRDENTIIFDIEYVGPDQNHRLLIEKLRDVEGVEILLEY
jgi:putative Mg2+ transporter-C (MgtC) family protein